MQAIKDLQSLLQAIQPLVLLLVPALLTGYIFTCSEVIRNITQRLKLAIGLQDIGAILLSFVVSVIVVLGTLIPAIQASGNFAIKTWHIILLIITNWLGANGSYLINKKK